MQRDSVVGAESIAVSAVFWNRKSDKLQNLIGSAPTLPGVMAIDGTGNTAPIILITAPEKAGKSSLATTLFGYPLPHQQPLIIAWDKFGPDSCVKLGFSPHVIRVADQTGERHWTKAQNALKSLESNIAAFRQQYGAIVVDCASTMADRLFEDARRTSSNPDPRSHYGDLLNQSGEFMNRVVDLGLPTIWLAWLKEPEIVEDKAANGKKTRRSIPGGANIIGNFRARLAGRAHHILVLERQYVGVGTAGADPDGHLRVLHTKPWAGINAGGRYSHVLPEPCRPDLGYVLGVISGSRLP